MRAERIARLLPEVYQRTIVEGTPIATLLDVMAELHQPVEDVLVRLPDYFDPQRTPDRFVPFLARWVDLARWLDETSGGFDSGIGRLRQVVAGAAQLSRLRGTAEGLRDALEWATGVAGVRIDEEVRDAAGRPRPFHVVVTLPQEAYAFHDLVHRIVQQEKPAHVTADIVFAGGVTEPAADPGPGAATEAAAREAPPTLPVGAPASPPEPSFPGSDPGPVLTGVPEPEHPAPASAPPPAAPPTPAPPPAASPPAVVPEGPSA